MLEGLQKRLDNLNIKVDFDQSTIAALADKGFDPVYGARPLRREIQSSIEDALSEKILDGSIKNGDKVRCTFENGVFEFK